MHRPPPETGNSHRWAWTLCLLVCLSLVASGRRLPATEPDRAGKIKAAFLINFIKFVDWPAGAHAASDSPLVVGVVGDEGFADYLARALDGKDIGARPVTVRRLPPEAEPADLVQAHALFLAAVVEDPDSIVERLPPDAAILVIEDGTTSFGRGTTICLVETGNKMRFDIDRRAAERRGLQVSSKLLRLARRTGKDG